MIEGSHIAKHPHLSMLTHGAGIDNDDRTAAVEEILRQLDEIRRGNITDAELEAARESIENDCRAAEDHPSDYEDFARIERLFGGAGREISAVFPLSSLYAEERIFPSLSSA